MLKVAAANPEAVERRWRRNGPGPPDPGSDEAVSTMFALTWRCDGSEGIKWYLRGIRDDGSFYGEVRFQSQDEHRRKAVSVSGQLAAAECDRMRELVRIIRQLPPPVEPGPHFAALFEWGPRGLGDARRLFEYRWRDEDHSESARAFVEMAGLIERHLSSFYEQIA